MKKICTKKLTVSIVMPVYNAARYVEEAVLSVQRQTFTDWELIVIDDASNDGSAKIVRKMASKDKRIVFYRNKKNRGIGATMNRLLTFARGKYIARMDSDDIMLATRIATQVAYLEKHKQVGVLGSYLAEINKDRELSGVRQVPTDHDSIVAGLLTRQTIQNPTLMLRVAKIPAKQLYFEPALSPVDDLEFYLRLASHKVKFANIPEYLMYYRAHGDNSSLRDIKKSFNMSDQIRTLALSQTKIKLGLRDRAIAGLQRLVVNSIPNKLLYRVYKIWQGSSVVGEVLSPVTKPREFSVSIVMPVYRGKDLIVESVERICNAMRTTVHKFELIVVEDGQVDTTAKKIKHLAKKYPELKHLSYQSNMGKGYAVRYGMRNVRYDYVGYVDAGHDISTNSLVNMIASINDNPEMDIWVADKTHPMAQIINVPLLRKVYSYFFREFVRILFGKKLKDTQVGLKIFRRETAGRIMRNIPLEINGFAYDVELLYVALQMNVKILHAPVAVKRNGEVSSVTIKHIYIMMIDMIRLWVSEVLLTKYQSLIATEYKYEIEA